LHSSRNTACGCNLVAKSLAATLNALAERAVTTWKSSRPALEVVNAAPVSKVIAQEPAALRDQGVLRLERFFLGGDATFLFLDPCGRRR
jgi:hypothetical protein